jgi:hypothetical protein
MTTVFLSGSRKIGRLNDMIRTRIENMVDQGFRIILGDANGADKALQGFLAEAGYQNVFVFCAGPVCRNNVGNWQEKHIQVDPKLKGRDFFTQKDKAMAAEADYGFVLWDGKSVGSINNVFELLKREKRVVVYLSREKHFVNMFRTHDVQELLKSCDSDEYRNIRKKMNSAAGLDDLMPSPQETLL